MKKFDGHINVGKRVTIYGDNAMHYAMNIWTKRWGYICFRPTTGKGKWKWYFYCSPNATPWAATFAIGDGIRKRDRILAKERRKRWEHNFSTEIYHDELMELNGSDISAT